MLAYWLPIILSLFFTNKLELQSKKDCYTIKCLHLLQIWIILWFEDFTFF